MSIFFWDQILCLGQLNVEHNLFDGTSSPLVPLLLIGSLPLKKQNEGLHNYLIV